MISVELNTREAIKLLESTSCSIQLKERIIRAMESAIDNIPVDNSLYTFHVSFSTGSRISVIKLARQELDWGFEAAKEWAKAEQIESPALTKQKAIDFRDKLEKVGCKVGPLEKLG